MLSSLLRAQNVFVLISTNDRIHSICWIMQIPQRYPLLWKEGVVSFSLCPGGWDINTFSTEKGSNGFTSPCSWLGFVRLVGRCLNGAVATFFLRKTGSHPRMFNWTLSVWLRYAWLLGFVWLVGFWVHNPTVFKLGDEEFMTSNAVILENCLSCEAKQSERSLC